MATFATFEVVNIHVQLVVTMLDDADSGELSYHRKCCWMVLIVLGKHTI